MRKTQDKKSSNLTLTVIQKDGNIYFTASAKAVIRQKKMSKKRKKLLTNAATDGMIYELLLRTAGTLITEQ